MEKLPNEQQESDFPVGIGKPAFRAITGAGYWRLVQLTQISEQELKRLHGVGPKAIEVLRRALEAQGLAFAEQKRK